MLLANIAVYLCIKLIIFSLLFYFAQARCSLTSVYMMISNNAPFIKAIWDSLARKSMS